MRAASEGFKYVIFVDLVRVRVKRFVFRLRCSLVPEIENIRQTLKHAYEVALRETFTG